MPPVPTQCRNRSGGGTEPSLGARVKRPVGPISDGIGSGATTVQIKFGNETENVCFGSASAACLVSRAYSDRPVSSLKTERWSKPLWIPGLSSILCAVRLQRETNAPGPDLE